jgi:hypothetical protein
MLSASAPGMRICSMADGVCVTSFTKNSSLFLGEKLAENSPLIAVADEVRRLKPPGSVGPKLELLGRLFVAASCFDASTFAHLSP